MYIYNYILFITINTSSAIAKQIEINKITFTKKIVYKFIDFKKKKKKGYKNREVLMTHRTLHVTDKDFVKNEIFLKIVSKFFLII